MATQSAKLHRKVGSSHNMPLLSRYVPFTDWIRRYDREKLTGDVIAGIIVAVMLVPQSMAYALLAGLPPEIGLYASIAPLIIYGLLGSSRVLAVGPVAMVSLLVATSVGQLAEPGTLDYISLTLTLTLMVALIQAGMGLLRVGFLVNFLSHAVLAGFTSAAALIIGFSQLKHLMGISIPRHEHVTETIAHAITHAGATNLVTLGIAVGSVAILLYFKLLLGKQLRAAKVPESVVVPVTKLGPLVAVLIGTLAVWYLNWDESMGVAIVGAVPAGLPSPTMPSLNIETIMQLQPIAITISLVGFMESISIAKSLASKRRQKVDANQELIALGLANVGASFTGGYPVTGGLSRSVVNFTAGARTGLASIITAALIILTVMFLTPLFYYLPQAVLGAIIVVAVASLFDYKTFVEMLRTSRPDALAMAVTFIAVLSMGIETGILVGAAAAIFLHMWTTSRPPIRQLGRKLGTEQYLDAEQYDVETQPDVLVMRVDESLYFPNAHHVEEYILERLAEDPEIKNVVLVCSAVNTVDASALHVLDTLVDEMRAAGTDLYMAEVKPHICDRFQSSGFGAKLGSDHIFTSTFEAYLRAKVPPKAKNTPQPAMA